MAVGLRLPLRAVGGLWLWDCGSLFVPLVGYGCGIVAPSSCRWWAMAVGLRLPLRAVGGLWLWDCGSLFVPLVGYGCGIAAPSSCRWWAWLWDCGSFWTFSILLFLQFIFVCRLLQLCHCLFLIHYENAYSNILKILPPKNEDFQIKKSYILHISAQNIDCGYSLEPPRRGGSKEYPQSMYWAEIRKHDVYSCKSQFYHTKVGFKGGLNYIGMFSWYHLTVPREGCASRLWHFQDNFVFTFFFRIPSRGAPPPPPRTPFRREANEILQNFLSTKISIPLKNNDLF